MSATVATGFDRAVAEALAWRLIEQEERITGTRAELRLLRRLGAATYEIALTRGYLWARLDERRGLKRRLAKEIGR